MITATLFHNLAVHWTRPVVGPGRLQGLRGVPAGQHQAGHPFRHRQR